MLLIGSNFPLQIHLLSKEEHKELEKKGQAIAVFMLTSGMNMIPVPLLTAICLPLMTTEWPLKGVL